MNKILNFLKEKYEFHWQNLNDLPGHKNRQGHPFWAVRCSFHLKNDKQIGLEWNCKSSFCGSYISFSDWGEDDCKLHFAIPPASLWLTFEGFLPKSFLKKTHDKKIGWSIHTWKLWISLWENKMSWSSKDPKWWSFNFQLDPRIILFGDTTYDSEVLKEEEVEVPMPEKTYKMKVKLCEDKWSYEKLPSWFGQKVLKAHCDLIEPIPHPGKGTTDYNCGYDALHYIIMPATSIDDAIGKVVTNVLDKRRRYPL